MDIKDFKAMIFTEAKNKGFEDCELYYMKSKSLQVQVFKGAIQQYSNSDVLGVSFRGIHNGKMGYAYSEKIGEDAVSLLVEQARKNAGIAEDMDELLYASEQKYSGGPDVTPLMEYSAEQQLQLAFDMENAAYGMDKRVESVDYCVVGKAVGEVYIANTHGMELNKVSGYAVGGLGVRASENGQTKMGYKIWTGRDLKDLNPEEIGRQAVRRALDYLGAERVEGGRASIIIRNETAVDFMSCFVPSYYGENVQKGFSLLKDKIGEQIASNIVTVRDDAAHPGSVEELAFDSEGVLVSNKTVIEKGVLKTYLHNMKSAAKDNIKSTGNGFKQSFKSPVATAHANYYIEPGEQSLDGLMAKMGTGYVITELNGLHSGVNAVSGDFSLLAEGFLVENGKIAKPVEQITIAGNYYEVLKNISGIGNDLTFDTPGAGGAVGMPSLLIENISISGK